jgi:hypothetical protein
MPIVVITLKKSLHSTCVVGEEDELGASLRPGFHENVTALVKRLLVHWQHKAQQFHFALEVLG